MKTLNKTASKILSTLTAVNADELRYTVEVLGGRDVRVAEPSPGHVEVTYTRTGDLPTQWEVQETLQPSMPAGVTLDVVAFQEVKWIPLEKSAFPFSMGAKIKSKPYPQRMRERREKQRENHNLKKD